MSNTKKYGRTKLACYLGFITQAIAASVAMESIKRSLLISSIISFSYRMPDYFKHSYI